MSAPPELRKDPVTSRWVLTAAAGGARPTAGPGPSRAEAPCPLCAGGAALGDAQRGVIANPNPLLDRRSPVDRSRSAGALHGRASAAGEHDLLVDVRAHGTRTSELSVPELAEVLAAWRERLIYYRQDNRFRHLGIVKREGIAAGALGEHASSEAYALPLVPPAVKEKIQGIQGHHRRAGTCVYCDVVRHERQEKVRRISESMRHVALAPYASRCAFEVLVLPKGHHFDFHDASDGDLSDLAGLLREVLARIDACLERPPWVLNLWTAPPDMGADLQQFHWHLEVLPHLGSRGSLGGALDVNEVPAEDAARALREVEP